MDEFLEQTEPQEEPERKRGGKGKRFLIFFLVLLAVLTVVLLAAWRDGTGFDVLRRYFSYGSEGEQAQSYTYESAMHHRFAALGSSLVVVSEREVQVLNAGGETVWSASPVMTNPALSVGGASAVAYDVGGTELYVVNAGGEVLHLSSEETLLSARLNESGWLAVTAERRNYKGGVSVYNDRMEKVFDFNSSERFVSTACVTEDCKHLAAVTLGQENSEFLSSIVLYDLNETEPQGSYAVPNGLVLDMGSVGGSITALCDTCLSFGRSSGTVDAVYSYEGRYLREYALGGEGFAALQLNRYQSGNAGAVVTVDRNGEELGRLEINEEIRDLSAAGRYLAVLYADRCVIYNPELQEYASLSGTDYARGVLMRSDGSALILSAERADLFLP